MKQILFVVALVNILSFAWSVVGVFVNHPQKNKKMYGLVVSVSLLTYGVTLYTLWFETIVNDIFFALSLTFMLLALAIFWYCTRIHRRQKLTLAFSQDIPKHLVTQGPYKWVRHPFYMSYLLCYFGAFLATLNLWLWCCLVAMTWIYFRASQFEESKFLDSNLAENYKLYQASTGRLFPKFFARIYKS